MLREVAEVHHSAVPSVVGEILSCDEDHALLLVLSSSLHQGESALFVEAITALEDLCDCVLSL